MKPSFVDRKLSIRQIERLQAEHIEFELLPNGLARIPVRPAFDRVADMVLAHRPKPKSKPAKKRARRKRKIQKRESSI